MTLLVRVGPCGVDIPDCVVRRGGDFVRLAASADGLADSRVRFWRFDGRVCEQPLVCSELPELTVAAGGAGGGRYELMPTALSLLGGTCTVAAAGSFAGPHGVRIDAGDVVVDSDALGRLADVLPPAVVKLEPRGVVSLGLGVTLDTGATDGRLAPTRFDARVGVRSGSFVTAGRLVDEVEAELEVAADERAVRVRRLDARSSVGTVAARGLIDLDGDPLSALPADAPADFELVVDVPDLARWPVPESAIRELAGSAAVDVCVDGPLDRLHWSSRGTLAAATLKMRGAIPSLEGITGDFVHDGDRVDVRRLAATLAHEPVVVQGHVVLADSARAQRDEGPFAAVDLRLVGHRVLLVREPQLRVRGDVDLRWRGDWLDSTLSGNVRILRSYYRRDVELSLRRRARSFDLFRLDAPPWDRMRFDVAVQSSKGFSLANYVANTRASLDLHLGGTGKEPRLTGTISTDEGSVTIAASKLVLESAMISFEERDPYDPTLQMVFSEDLRGYRVTVTIAGTMEEPEVLLSSSPPLEYDDLLLLLTTGYTVNELRTEGAGNVAATRLAAYFGRRVAGYFMRGEPAETGFLSRLAFETEAAREAYLDDSYRLEYRVHDDLLIDGDQLFLQTERDAYGNYNFNLGIRVEIE